MAEMEDVINQAIADFDDIEMAIEEKGVDVPAGTDTKDYGNLIRSIQTGGLVDQEYNPESENAQSGKAVAGALATQPIKYLESLDKENYLNLFDLESGMYILYGYFLIYPNATKRVVFSKKLFVAVSKGSISTCIQVLYPPYNTVQYLNIYPPDEEAGTDYTYERKDAELYYMESVENKVTEIDENSDDTHYPSAKAVYNKVKDTSNSLKGTASGEVIRVDDVNPIEHTVKAKAKSKNLIPMFIDAHTRSHANITQACYKGGQSITLNGTASEVGGGRTSFKTVCLPFEIKKGKTYTLSHKLVGGSVEGLYHLYLTNYDTDNSVQAVISDVSYKTFTADTDCSCYIGINVTSGSIYTNAEIVFMLEEGDTATEYEPYVDPSTVTVTRCGKNLFDTTKYETRTTTVNGVTVDILDDGCIYVHGTPIDSTNATSITMSHYQEVDVFPKGTYVYDNSPSVKNDNVLCFPQANKPSNGAWIINFLSTGTYVPEEFCINRFVVYIKAGATEAINAKYYIQVEVGENTTDYEAYKGVSTYTPEADGTVNGITSLSPTMTLLTDKAGVTIEAEYNQDSNSVREGIRKDISELDRVTAELIGDMGDIDTALDSIIAIQESLIGGATE